LLRAPEARERAASSLRFLKQEAAVYILHFNWKIEDGGVLFAGKARGRGRCDRFAAFQGDRLL